MRGGGDSGDDAMDEDDDDDGLGGGSGENMNSVVGRPPEVTPLIKIEVHGGCRGVVFVWVFGFNVAQPVRTRHRQI